MVLLLLPDTRNIDHTNGNKKTEAQAPVLGAIDPKVDSAPPRRVPERTRLRFRVRAAASDVRKPADRRLLVCHLHKRAFHDPYATGAAPACQAHALIPIA